MSVLYYLIVFTYSATLLMLLLVVSTYRRGSSRVWPPKSPVILAIGWIWYLSAFTAALWLSFFKSPLQMPLSDLPWKILGWTLIMVSIILGMWAVAAFRSIRRVSGGRVDTLITWGPYRYVRNPQYTSLMLLLLGITLVQNSFYFLLFSVLEAATFHMIALLEERELERIFGEEYLRYKRDVPRYLPRLKGGIA